MLFVGSLNNFVNKSYQETFESISHFSSPEFNLSKTLDENETQLVVEITEKDYISLISNGQNVPALHLKKTLK